MKSINLTFSLLAILLSANVNTGFSQSKSNKKNKMDKAPIAEIIPETLQVHNHTRIDNYYWLNNREDKKVIQYLEQENAYTKKQLNSVKDLEDKLFAEITGRIKQDDNSVPFKRNGYYYYTRYEEKKEYPIYCRKKGDLNASEEVILDVNSIAQNKDFCNIPGLSISPNGRYMAYALDSVGRNLFTVNIFDLSTGTQLTDQFPSSWGNIIWANNNSTLYYDVKDESLRSFKVYRHHLGSDSKNDQLIFEEKDETFSVSIGKTKSDKFIVISSGSTLTSEYRYADADDANADFKIFQVRERGHEYSIDHLGDHFYILTNDRAKNFRLMKCYQTDTDKHFWKEVIAHREDVLLEGMELFDSFLVVEERKDGLNQIRITDQTENEDHYLEFPDAAYSAYLSSNYESDSQVLRFAYVSLNTPPSVIDYHMINKTRTVMKETEVVGTYNKDDYETERLYITVRDGVKVPVSLIYKKGTALNGTAPMLVYGYGSYGHSLDPGFSYSRVSLLDRGFVYAILHVRGGEEMGRFWYEDGKLLKKKNTFYDFIDCTKYLQSQKYSSPQKTFAMGGSAGGLLMGAVMNMAPELYHGVIAAVPFVDVVTTMLDESIPLTTGEFDEWGNPKDQEYYNYILSYSPYDNVERKAYPNVLVTTGLHDSQVQYWEPAKWVAKLRTHKTDSNLLLMHTNMEAGHEGASGRFTAYKEIAMEYAFMLMLADIKF